MILDLNSVLVIVDEHSRKAAESDYDRGVAIRAVSVVRKSINDVFKEVGEIASKGKVIDVLELLKKDYNDTDGQYTNGKGVIGSVIDDIRMMRNEGC